MEVRLNEFGIEIIGAREVIGQNVIMSQGEYKIKLYNHHNVRCDAYVKVNGESAGVFRIDPNDTITLERPSQEQRRFTFVSEHSSAAREAGEIPGRLVNGLVEATFKLEQEARVYEVAPMMSYQRSESKVAGSPRLQSRTMSRASARRSPRVEAGTTVLGRYSNQRFVKVGLLDYDLNATTTITLRLVLEKPYSPRYVSMSPRRTRVPPRPFNGHLVE